MVKGSFSACNRRVDEEVCLLSKPDAPVAVNLSNVLVYLTCIQSFVASVAAVSTTTLTSCLAPGNATRALLAGAAAGFLVTSRRVVSDQACRSLLTNVLAPLCVACPLTFLAIVQLEGSARDTTERLRVVVHAVAIAVAVVGALARALYPSSKGAVDVAAAVAAAVLILILHPPLAMLDDVEPLDACPSMSTAAWRMARLCGGFVTVAQTVVLVTIRDELTPREEARLVVCACASAFYILLIPTIGLLACPFHVCLLVARRSGACGCLDRVSCRLPRFPRLVFVTHNGVATARRMCHATTDATRPRPPPVVKAVAVAVVKPPPPPTMFPIPTFPMSEHALRTNRDLARFFANNPQARGSS